MSVTHVLHIEIADLYVCVFVGGGRLLQNRKLCVSVFAAVDQVKKCVWKLPQSQ